MPLACISGGGRAIFPHVRPIFRKRRTIGTTKLCKNFYRISIIFKDFKILQFNVDFCKKTCAKCDAFAFYSCTKCMKLKVFRCKKCTNFHFLVATFGLSCYIYGGTGMIPDYCSKFFSKNRMILLFVPFCACAKRAP
jgi:hypothetical protein